MTGRTLSCAEHAAYSHVASGPVVSVPIARLLPADSPRLAGEDQSHARVLAELDVSLPPIIVHRSTMRVIDGMHRLRAAVLRGDDEIGVQFFDGDQEDAFLLAVQANTAHGLPLSLNDRKAAASRIIGTRPYWSDRAIASACGLSDKTVGAMRTRVTSETPQSHTRLGQDGRVRPLNTVEGRRRASELMADAPGTSLRQIAEAAGVSTATVRDVRDRLRRGEDPIPPRQRTESSVVDSTAAMRNLRTDPAMRFTDPGRKLLRLLEFHAISSQDCSMLVDHVPVHCAELAAELADRCAVAWQELSEQLKRRRLTDA